MPYAEGEEGSASANPGSKSRKNLENMCTKCFSSVVNKDLDEVMLETNICVCTGVDEDCLYIVLIVAWLFTKAPSTCVMEVNGRRGGSWRVRVNYGAGGMSVWHHARFPWIQVNPGTVPDAVTFLPCFPHPWNNQGVLSKIRLVCTKGMMDLQSMMEG